MAGLISRSLKAVTYRIGLMLLPGWRGLSATLTWPSIASLSKSMLPTMTISSLLPGRIATSAALFMP